MMNDSSYFAERSPQDRPPSLSRHLHLTKKVRHLNTDFALLCGGYHIRIANGDNALQARADSLVERLYRARGLTPPPPATLPHKTRQYTLASCRDSDVFGTLTLGIDKGRGLMADGLYHREIEPFRARGRRACEVTRLAMERTHDDAGALARIFNLAFITARHAHGVTDAFIEVHPRHAGFYQRRLGYRRIGPERICPRVGAPAVLLHLCLKTIEQRIRELAGRPASADRSLYQHFMPPAQQASVIEQLIASPEGGSVSS